MKHASARSLDSLEEVLAAVRLHHAVRERSRGVFHLRSRAFLHFHEDPRGLFADLRRAGGWRRLRVQTKKERARLLCEVERELREPPPPRTRAARRSP